jgi:hypothetical protein
MKFLKPSATIVFIFCLSFSMLNAQSTAESISKKEAQAKKELEYKKQYEEQRKAMAAEIARMKPAEREFVYASRYFGGESSELSLRKNFTGQTLESKKSFDINDKSTRISLSLSGVVESGLIEIILESPDGKNYITLQIDNTSDVSWRQNINIDERNKYLKGKWQITVKTNKADGNYNFRMSAE